MAVELETTKMELSRLIVLVPAEGAYGIELARRIWALAGPCELKVLFLCVLGQDLHNESAVRLRLSTLASQIRYDRVEVETHIDPALTWIEAVGRNWQPGDIVICCAEQMIRTEFYGNQPLCQVLEQTLDVPVFVLTGLYSQQPEPVPDKYWRITRWLIPIAIVIGFFYVESHVDSVTLGLAHTLLLTAVALAEIGLLAAWSLFT
jgi:hypothetical protein